MAEAEQGNAEDIVDNGEREQKKSKRKLIIIIALGVLLVGGGGVGAAVFLSGGSKPEVEVVADKVEAESAAEKEQSPAPEKGKVEPSSEVAASGGQATRPPEGNVGDLGIDFGDTYKMKTFHLNLGNALENRYVRLEVTLEYNGGEAQKKEIEKRTPQLRDAVISIISRKTREFILSPDGKDALRKEILIRINRYMKTKIEAVYITDILIE
ncbi:MAG: flagellar basal body-associated FliL family protein [Oligoflexus sp.]